MGDQLGGGDDAARRDAKRERDRDNARRRRAARRAAREAAWKEAAATGATGGSVVTIDTPPSALLATHIVRTARYLELLERDETTSIAEKARVFIGAIPALARAVDCSEFGARLAAVEKAQASQARPQLRSVGS